MSESENGLGTGSGEPQTAALAKDRAQVGQESRNTALPIWFGTNILGLIPSLILYLVYRVKKDDAYILDQFKEALNWSIAAAIGIVHLHFCVMAAIACSKGDSFRVPFALRLIK